MSNPVISNTKESENPAAIGFESFPIRFQDDSDEETNALATRIKRFFNVGSTAASSSSTTSQLSETASGIHTASSTSSEHESSTGSRKSPPHSRSNTSLVKHPTLATTKPSPLPPTSPTLSDVPSLATLPNGRKFVRPIRLSGVTPSLQVTAATSENGDLVQAKTSTSLESPATADRGSLSHATYGSPSQDVVRNIPAFSVIPGFPLGRNETDDSRSIRSFAPTAAQTSSSASVAHIIRKLRGEGLSKIYWIADESAKECFSCSRPFTTFRRRHHCRMCGRIFCTRCASNMIPGQPFNQREPQRVCDICYNDASQKEPASEDTFALRSSTKYRDSSSQLSISRPLEASARPSQSLVGNTPLKFAPAYHARHYTIQEIGRRGSETSSIPSSPYSDDGDAHPAMSAGSPPNARFKRRADSISVSASTSVAPFRRNLAEDDKGPVSEHSQVSDLSGGNDASIENGLDADAGAEADVEENGTIVGDPKTVKMGAILSKVETELDVNADVQNNTPQSPEEVESDEPRLGSRRLSATPAPSPTRPKPLLPSTQLSPSVDRPATPVLDRAKSQLSSNGNDTGSNFVLHQESFHQGPGPDPQELQRILATSGVPQDIQNVLSSGKLDLSSISLQHIRLMLHQSLTREGIPNVSAWEKELLPLLMRAVNNTEPNLRTGDSMDVRRYIHLKKVPGGRPRDSEYVEGVVFTKNVLHKQMARNLVNPRIMLFSFSLEYQRVENQLMSLEPLLKQEREYLRNLVARIVALRPHIVLVEKNVSRLAVEYLMEAHVAVARNVKPKCVDSVARSTQADIISSMEKLVLEPRLGRCKGFRVQTFVHSAIAGKRKTFLRFEGCKKGLGCTILLRGAPLETLRKIKRIAEMMILVIYNAKLESHVIMDELVAPDANDASLQDRGKGKDKKFDEKQNDLEVHDVTEISEHERITGDIARSLRPYDTAAISASPYVRFNAPYPLERMSEEDRKLVLLRHLKEKEETQQILHEEMMSRESVPALSSSCSSTSVSSLPSSFASETITNPSKPAEKVQNDPLKVLQMPEDLIRSNELTDAEHRHAEQLQLWDAYVSKTTNILDPARHQRLFVLETLQCSKTRVNCEPPLIRPIDFYAENDCTIGQYMERVLVDGGKVCPAGTCQNPLMVHYRTYVHGNTRITVEWRPTGSPVQGSDGYEDGVLMYGFCRRCAELYGKEDPRVKTRSSLMSPETFNFSFGRYLELTFYGQGLFRSDGLCWHNPLRDFERCWHERGITFSIMTDLVEVHNIAAPPRALKIEPSRQLLLRNEEYVQVLQKSNAFWDSILNRIGCFNFDLVQSDRLAEMHAAMETLRSKCEADRKALTRLLETTYDQSQASNGTEMTSVRRNLQTKAVEWENEWTSLEQRIIPLDKDVRRLTTVQLKRLFSDGSIPLSPERQRSVSMTLAPSLEIDEKADKLEPQILTSPGIIPLRSVSDSLTPFVPSTTPPGPTLERMNNANESDSTICGDFIAEHGPRYGHEILSLEPGNAVDSEVDSESAQPRRKFVRGGRGVATLVSLFQDPNQDPETSALGVTRSPAKFESRPSLRRSATEKPRGIKSRISPSDVFSDGDGSYARNVGITYLSPRPMAEKTSKIPSRKWTAKASALSNFFDTHDALKDSLTPSTKLSRSPVTSPMSTSPVNSRSPSRASSLSNQNRGTSAHRHVTDGLPSTAHATRPLLPSRSSSKSIKGKHKEKIKGDTPASDTSSVTKKSKLNREFSVSRPTTSSSNKAVSNRRIFSGSNTPGQRVSTIANHFNKLTQTAEKERERKMSLFRGKKARPVAMAHPTIQVFDNVRDAIKEDSDDDENNGSSDGADDEYDDDFDHDGEEEARAAPVDGGPEPQLWAAGDQNAYSETKSLVTALLSEPPPLIEEIKNNDSKGPSSEPNSTEAPSLPVSPHHGDTLALPRMSEGESSGNERGSIIKAISNLWAYRGGEFTPLDYPLNAGEHVFADNPILVQEDEPSSIIAFALSSKAYREKLKENDSTARSIEKPEGLMNGDMHLPDRVATLGVSDLQKGGTEMEDTLRKPEAKHFRLQYEEGTTSFFCKIFFAEQFDALRRNCGCPIQFIESLSRCVKWESSGGRSKVDFLKTRDDRFIVKEISRPEMDALLRFAPAYFEYMSRAIFHGLPTILAKIFGFYRIGLRNPATGKVMRLDILVMENLFYNRQLSKVYDLKGSTRNRLVQVKADKPNEVLMDENLVQISFTNPLYIREDSKRFLKAATFNDSLFLSDLNVMDYSLVVGVDSVKQELVVGIVDFIRTYTWDKKLESWVKDSGFLGGASKPGGPTIVTPKQYKTRFRQAIDGYFLLAPDAWLDPTTLDNDAKQPNPAKETFTSIDQVSIPPSADLRTGDLK